MCPLPVRAVVRVNGTRDRYSSRIEQVRSVLRNWKLFGTLGSFHYWQAQVYSDLPELAIRVICETPILVNTEAIGVREIAPHENGPKIMRAWLVKASWKMAPVTRSISPSKILAKFMLTYSASKKSIKSWMSQKRYPTLNTTDFDSPLVLNRLEVKAPCKRYGRSILHDTWKKWPNMITWPKSTKSYEEEPERRCSATFKVLGPPTGRFRNALRNWDDLGWRCGSY